MDELTVHSSSHSYPVYIGKEIRFEIGKLLRKNYSHILLISDENVADLYLQDVLSGLPKGTAAATIIPAGEAAKSIKTFYSLHTKALELGLDRESLIIALGGGVVGDVAGFVAATYMRGIDYIQVPTTILAHDSSVGGKVAINHELGKNMIGNFYPPVTVVYDVATLKSLSRQEVRSGYAELVKEALIADRPFFNEVLETDLRKLANERLISHLKKGIGIKAKIVEEDEKESGVRKYLNLGHTLAHALEAEFGYGTLTHGEAVGIGLLFALFVSACEHGKKLPYDELYEWLMHNEYPLTLPSVHASALLQKMKHDKKSVKQNVQMVLLDAVANPYVTDIKDRDLLSYLDAFIGKLVKA